MLYSKRQDSISYAVRQSGSAVGWCSLTIRAGARDEDGFHHGIAHFLEHTMFKGTSSKSAAAINSCLDKLGGELNAYTAKEEIVLHATVLKEDLEKAVSLLLEIAFDAQFPDAQVEIEKGVVLDEIQSYKDSPSEDIYDVFEEKIFKGHPLEGSILGNCDSVSAITPDELRQFRDRYFTPGNMTLSMVSPMEEEEMEHIAKRQIARWTKGHDCPNSCPERQSRRIEETGVFDVTEDKHNHEANCIMGSLAPNMYDREDRLAALLLCNMLGGPACNSILGSQLRERHGWVYNVECMYMPYSDNGIASIMFGCEKHNVRKCKKAIFNELRKLREKPLSERKLSEAKKQILGQHSISLENGEARCISMGKTLSCHGKLFEQQQTVEDIMGISADRVLRICREIFDPGKMSVLTYL